MDLTGERLVVATPARRERLVEAPHLEDEPSHEH